MRKEISTKTLVYYAVFIALTTVMTMIAIPMPATKGYLNLGDMVIFLSAIFLGKSGGLIVGGVGSSMADILLGYTHYAPITLVVKGIEGLLVGFLLEKNVKPIIAAMIGGIFMASGYLTVELFIYGKAAFVSFPGNIGQGLVGAFSAILVYNGIRKTKLISVK